MAQALDYSIAELKKQLTGFNKAAGVEVFIHDDGNITYHLTCLSLQKNIIKLVHANANIQSVDDLRAQSEEDIPVCLVINGKGVIHRKIPAQADNPATIIKFLFPNANAEEFYLQQQSSTEGGLFISLIRKEVLQRIITNLEQKGITVVDVSMGPFCLCSIAPLLSVNLSGAVIEFKLASHHLRYNNGILDYYAYHLNGQESKMYKIGDSNLEENVLVSYAGAFQFLFLSCGNIHTPVKQVLENRKEWEQKKIFKIAGLSILIFFLTILFINFIFFGFLSSKNSELQEQQTGSKGQLMLLQNLKEQVKIKETFLNQTNWLNGSKVSYYADKIGTTLPVTLSLTKLEIYPIHQSKNIKNKKLSFLHNKMKIAGTCMEGAELNKWITILRENSWLEDVIIKEFNKETSSKNIQFELELKLK